MEEIKTKVLIIGSGPAGYTAGIYLGRACLNPIVVSGPTEGGQLTKTPDIENFPGFPTALTGFELMDKMKEQAINYGAKFVRDTITKVNFSKRPFRLETEEGKVYIADTIIIATGAKPKKLGISSEAEFAGKGISYCATCDGFLYKNKEVCVVGGGNTAVKEALYLANFCSKVYLIHRRDELRAEKIYHEKIFNHEKIEPVLDSVIEEFAGEEYLKSIKVKNIKTNEIKEITAEGVFLSIGYDPSSEVFKNDLEIDEKGFIKTKENSCMTSVEGVFAAGDVSSPKYKQAVIAAGFGAMASMELEHFLQENE